MRDSSRKIIVLQWVVIAVLVLGGGACVYLLMHHANSVDLTNSQLTGDNDSLKRQVDQLHARIAAAPTPSPTPSPIAIPTKP